MVVSPQLVPTTPHFTMTPIHSKSGLSAAFLLASASVSSGELLYNGIELPATWPPRTIDPASAEPEPPPYLRNPPEVIPIDVGRQLFVDDFLVEETTLETEYHLARKLEGNPVFRPETPMEKQRGMPVAAPKSGGVWWDPQDQLFKMWYEAGWLGNLAYATSRDGVRWERPGTPTFGGAANGIVYSLRPDSTTVFLDPHTADPAARFKLFLRGPGGAPTHGYCMTSPDGLNWSAPVITGKMGDRSTMFYNPFRKKWVYSIRSTSGISGARVRGRHRFYREHDDFLEGAKWQREDLVYWTKADKLDPPDPEIGAAAQLYNLDAVAYESLMLGVFQIHRGPENDICMNEGTPKITELTLAYSRDGFHWHRPDRRAFIPATRQPGDWDRGYVQSVGGVCLIVGDELWFYYAGFQGAPGKTDPFMMRNGMYANGATGIAKLRRDGFVSRNAGKRGGHLTTRPVVFSGKHLFVNADAKSGTLRVEVLDQAGNPIPPFTLDNARPFSEDSTQTMLGWKGADDLSQLRGKPIRFRFHLESAKLYAFWVAPTEDGASGGYPAAGEVSPDTP